MQKRMHGPIKGSMSKQYIYSTWPEETPTAKKVRMQFIKPQTCINKNIEINIFSKLSSQF
jgi:hypothetical protein